MSLCGDEAPARTGSARGAFEVRSAGSVSAEKANPAAVATMTDVRIDIPASVPKAVATDAVQAPDVLITMRCRDTYPAFAGKRNEDEGLKDRAGRDIEAFGRSGMTSAAGIGTLTPKLLPANIKSPDGNPCRRRPDCSALHASKAAAGMTMRRAGKEHPGRRPIHLTFPPALPPQHSRQVPPSVPRNWR